MRKHLGVLFLVLSLVCAAGTAHAGFNVGLLWSDGISPSTEVEQFLYDAYFIDSVTVVDVYTATPTLTELQDFDVIVVHINYPPNDATAVGDVLADYVDLGNKGLVLCAGASITGWSILGRLNSGGYKPIVDGGYTTSPVRTAGTIANTPVDAGLSALTEYITALGGLASGATSLGTFNDGVTLLGAYKGNVVQMNFFFPTVTTEMLLQERELMLNAIYYAVDLMDAWEAKAVLPAARQYATAVSDGQYIYSILGASVLRYNPQMDIWDTMAVMPASLSFFQAVYVDGKLYVPGGYNGSGYDCQMYIYDIVGNSWTTDTDACANPSSGYSAAYLNGYVYHLGGYSAPTWLTAVDRYNIAAGTWESVASMNSARWQSAAWAREGKVYIAGGKLAMTTGNPMCEAYDPAGNTWSDAGCSDLMGQRLSGGAVFYNGLLFFAGGMSYQPLSYTFNNAVVYDPVLDLWQPWPTLMTQTTFGNSVAAVDGMLHSLGGTNPTDHQATPICYPYELIADGDTVTGDTSQPDFGNYYNGYSINPARNESGADTKYQFTLAGDLLVYAVLSGNACDLDLFLLDDCDPSRSVAWGDTAVALEMSAGTYYLAVDGNAGAACSYTLDFLACAGCVIDDICYDDGDPNPGNACEICDVATDRLSWSPNDGASCDDSLFCNGADTCLSGACSQHTGDPCPDDALWCNGAESCDETADACVHEFDDVTTFRCPDDTLFCTGVESCDETTDACLASGDPCDADETCNETTDTCDENVDDDTTDDDLDDDVVDDDVVDDDVTDDDVDDDADDDATGGGGGGGDDDDSGCGC